MLTAVPLAFLIDVDNTLFDNDQFAAGLTARLDLDFGITERERYWSIYRELRDKKGFADYLGALQKFRTGIDNDTRCVRQIAPSTDSRSSAAAISSAPRGTGGRSKSRDGT